MDQSSGPSWPRLLLACCLIGISLAQKDPTNNFCRRFGHQTAVVDRKLYIDGGIINYQPPRENFTNTFFTYNDLDSVSDEAMPEFHTGLSKNGTIPSVQGGILWEDSINKRLYLYGGDYEDVPTEPFSLYSYDILYDEWHNYGSPPNSVKAASYGAGVSVPSRGEAYYYGGWLSEKSVQDWEGDRQTSSGLIKYTMVLILILIDKFWGNRELVVSSRIEGITIAAHDDWSSYCSATPNLMAKPYKSNHTT